ncbi:hypothetical protein ACIBEJ_44185 [Nonomuraea sp. NPDC050790]|uniref:hypothetical protein n=1 Tax=Nonomuraea sp. NPDC050790 TaxID=3364371 RepID=UPI0037A38E43
MKVSPGGADVGESSRGVVGSVSAGMVGLMLVVAVNTWTSASTALAVNANAKAPMTIGTARGVRIRDF